LQAVTEENEGNGEKVIDQRCEKNIFRQDRKERQAKLRSEGANFFPRMARMIADIEGCQKAALRFVSRRLGKGWLKSCSESTSIPAPSAEK
jgi:hypothetical protein